MTGGGWNFMDLKVGCCVDTLVSTFDIFVLIFCKLVLSALSNNDCSACGHHHHAVGQKLGLFIIISLDDHHQDLFPRRSGGAALSRPAPAPRSARQGRYIRRAAPVALYYYSVQRTGTYPNIGSPLAASLPAQ